MVAASTAANMWVLSILGLALSVTALKVLHVKSEMYVTLDSVDVTNNDNDFFDEWSTEIHDTKKSSQLSVKLPTKADVPDSLQVKITLQLLGTEPIEYVLSICDALNDDVIGKSFVNAGEPSDDFPKDCPFVAGDWSVSKWSPSTDAIPDGTPEGPISGSVSFYEEGKDPIIVLDYKGKLIKQK